MVHHTKTVANACKAALVQVRAYDKKPLMPDSLLGEAKVALSELSLSDSHVAGSGGGQNVQVSSDCLRLLVCMHEM